MRTYKVEVYDEKTYHGAFRFTDTDDVIRVLNILRAGAYIRVIIEDVAEKSEEENF